jgi:DNA (cytosine-5)-methyltransferase 1
MAFKAGQSEAAVGFHHKQDPISGHVSPAIGRETDGMGVLCISETGQGFWTAGEPLAGLRADPGGMPAHVICTTGDITHALTHEGADASEDGTGRGTPIVVTRDQDDAQTLPCLPASLGGSPTGHNRDELVIATITSKWAKGSGGFAGTSESNNLVVVPTLAMGAHTAAPGSNGQDALQYADALTRAQGRPRRLTPLECERLMSWPDTWTATGRKDDGTEYALSDTARYRLCGNGVGSVCAEWIGRRLMAAITAQGAA